jgi:hypothetical protein
MEQLVVDVMAEVRHGPAHAGTASPIDWAATAAAAMGRTARESFILSRLPDSGRRDGAFAKEKESDGDRSCCCSSSDNRKAWRIYVCNRLSFSADARTDGVVTNVLRMMIRHGWIQCLPRRCCCGENVRRLGTLAAAPLSTAVV